MLSCFKTFSLITTCYLDSSHLRKCLPDPFKFKHHKNTLNKHKKVDFLVLFLRKRWGKPVMTSGQIDFKEFLSSSMNRETIKLSNFTYSTKQDGYIEIICESLKISCRDIVKNFKYWISNNTKIEKTSRNEENKLDFFRWDWLTKHVISRELKILIERNFSIYQMHKERQVCPMSNEIKISIFANVKNTFLFTVKANFDFIELEK